MRFITIISLMTGILVSFSTSAPAQQYNRSGSSYDDGRFASGTYSDGTGWTETRDRYGSTYSDSTGRGCVTSSYGGYNTTTCSGN
jgi:hypothetical protein